MKRFFKKYWQPYMLRPLIHKTFSRFIYSMTIALIWQRFSGNAAFFSLGSYTFPLIGLFWGLMAWFAFLHLDGIKLPRLLTLQTRRHESDRSSYRDIIDFADEKVISFDDLEEDERTVCVLAADLLVCILFFVLSLFWL